MIARRCWLILERRILLAIILLDVVRCPETSRRVEERRLGRRSGRMVESRVLLVVVDVVVEV